MKNSVPMDDLQDVKELSQEIMNFYAKLFSENEHHIVISAICSSFVHSTIEKSVDLQKACAVVEAAVKLFEIQCDKMYEDHSIDE